MDRFPEMTTFLTVVDAGSLSEMTRTPMTFTHHLTGTNRAQACVRRLNR